MTFRERLADWISGGALRHERMQKQSYERAVWVWHRKAADRRDALCEIIALETPRCAHIGKRMARIAKEALE